MLQQLRSWWPGALAGLAAIALGLAVSELVARLVDGASLVVAIGDIVIDNSPSSVSKWAIDTFGTKDKPILVAGVTVTTLAVGTGLGLLSMRYRLIGVVGLAALSVVGGLAAAHDPLVSDADALATAASAAVAGIAVLLGLLWTATATRPAAGDSTDDNSVPRMERRQFLLFSGGGLAVAALMAPLARRFIDTGVDVDAQRASIVLPKASSSSRTQQAAAAATATPAATPDTSSEATATSTPSAEETAEATAATETPTATDTATAETSDTAAADQADAEATPEPTAVARPGPETVRGISPLVTPNDKFYRIDTELSVPRIDIEDWRLTIKGMVDREMEFSFADLLDRGVVEESVTLACVSNNVGGRLVGNAYWLGVPLPDLLQEAGVQSGATQVVGRSVDGFTVGFPTNTALDGRQSMVVIGMNGEPLPAEHGFPARLIVPGLFGYVSATKWLKEIELADWDSFDAYWVGRRGWSKEGPIKLQSRIDVPDDEDNLKAGNVRVAGVAWAGLRGISGVQVRPHRRSGSAQSGDNGWLDAILSEELSDSSWRQWVVDWPATEGSFDLEVRAIDRGGVVQTADERPPKPEGATGRHTIRVNVES